MLRIWQMLFLTAMARAGQPGTFDGVPFEEWLKAGRQAKIQWTLRAFPARLSEYQRLETSILASVDASEFVKRPGRGRMELFLELRDRENRTYRSHRELSLRKRTNPRDLIALRSVEHACLVPGDYEVAAAIYDRKTKEHSLKRISLRIPPLARDPLPGAWRDLPAVELNGCGPLNAARLELEVSTPKPLHVEVVMNQSVNRDKTLGSVQAQTARLVARLEVLTEMKLPNGSMNVTLIDVDRGRVTYSEPVEGAGIRRRLGPALRENNPNKIDIHSLENYRENPQFFLSEIRKRLESAEPGGADKVLIVLSAPLELRKDADLRPIETTAAVPVYYIRCRQPVFAPQLAIAETPVGGLRAPSIAPEPLPVPAHHFENNTDSLEPTLRPLHPRLFDVTTAVDFRNALAAIIGQLSQR